MTAIRFHSPEDMAAPPGLFSRAARVHASEYLWIAGQVACDAAGNVVGAGDCAAQVRQSFANLEAVLRAEGAGFRDVVKFTTYLVGRDSLEPFRQVREELFETCYPDGNYPVNTLLFVDGFVREEYLVEIEAIAAR